MCIRDRLMVERLNSDLANTLGNLVNRTISMTNKYFGGTVTDTGVAEEVDADLKAVVENTAKAVDEKTVSYTHLNAGIIQSMKSEALCWM